MGTRDALLQIQMGTYANGVTCYYTFPYTNNVLIEPTPYVRRVRGGGKERLGPPFSSPAFIPAGPCAAPRTRRKCGEDIRYVCALHENRFIDYSVVSSSLSLDLCIVKLKKSLLFLFYFIYFDINFDHYLVQTNMLRILHLYVKHKILVTYRAQNL